MSNNQELGAAGSAASQSLHVGVSIQQLLDKGKTAVRIDFF